MISNKSIVISQKMKESGLGKYIIYSLGSHGGNVKQLGDDEVIEIYYLWWD